MNETYQALIIFYYVIYYSSFTRAAEHLKCSKAHVSKQVAFLERLVGTSLLHRNARILKTTFAGDALFKHAGVIVAELQSTENTMSSLQYKTEGILRVTSPRAYAEYFLACNLPQFLEQYPDLCLEMNHSNLFLNLVDEKIDVAIRITHEPPLDRVAKRIGSDQMVICASETYLKAHGQPQTPKQLHQHACLVYGSEQDQRHWVFQMVNDPVKIAVKPKIMSNSASVVLLAALNGLGLARLPKFTVEEHIRSGRLQVVLSDFYLPPTPIYAIFAQSRMIPPKTLAFVQFLERIHQDKG